MRTGYWLHETSGVLRPAVEAYLRNEPMTAIQIAAMRAYLRQWVEASVWRGPGVGDLRKCVDTLTSRKAIDDWLHAALDLGIDPL